MRPHVLTVIIGLLSPALALVALVMSGYSYQVAKESLKISHDTFGINRDMLQVVQRAYLTIEDVELTLSHPNHCYVDTQAGQQCVRVNYQFTIYNMGNTPAIISKPLKHHRFTFPKTWSVPEAEGFVPGSVAPHSKAVVSAGMDAVLADSDFKIYSDFNNWLLRNPKAEVVHFARDQIFGESQLDYEDIFQSGGVAHNSYHLRWCWTENLHSPFVFPDSCAEKKHSPPYSN